MTDDELDVALRAWGRQRVRVAQDLPVLEPVLTRPRRPLLLAVAASIVVVLAIGTVTTVFVHHGSTSPSEPALTNPHAIPPGAADPNHARAASRAEQIANSLPNLPGADSQPSAPTAAVALQSVFIEIAPGRTVHQVRWWTAPGSAASAIAFLQRHPPRDSRQTGYGTSGPSGPRTVDFNREDDDITSGLIIAFVVAPFRGGVAVRADVLAVWLPSRRTDSIIARASSARVTVVGRINKTASSPTRSVSRVLGRQDADRIARVINALPGAQDDQLAGYKWGCRPDQFAGAVTDSVVIRTPGGTFQLRFAPLCSLPVLVTPTGARYVLGSDYLHVRLLAVLGLPPDWSQP